MAGDTLNVDMVPFTVLYYDIETAPMISHLWNPKVSFVGQHMNISDTYVLTWAAKWGHQKSIKSASMRPSELHEQDDSRIVLQLADMIRKADIVVAHNGDRFDLKKLNGRVALHGEEPLGPVKTIDTLKLSRKSFGYSYHNLDFLAKTFLGEKKIKTDFDLWVRATHGDEAAMREMSRYCRYDVVLLEQVLEAIKPYVVGLPRMVSGTGVLCVYCGSSDLQKRGTRETNAFTYQQYQCNRCKRYSRHKKAEKLSLETRPI